ncbi:MAG: 3-phosphoshikimate 1-carboxyvinyltransferase [Pseudomonadota bacterium]
MPGHDDILQLPNLPGQTLSGSVRLPGDKALAHRILILAAMARGETLIRGLPAGDDVDATCRCLSALGVTVERCDDAARVVGLGRGCFTTPKAPLDCGASASTMRMLMGAVAGRGRAATFTGDETLLRRPMDRVARALAGTGATVTWEDVEGRPPCTVRSAKVPRPQIYALPVPSGQVKTALILAALGAAGRTEIAGRIDSRDHTERLVPRLGGRLVTSGGRIIVEGGPLEAVAYSLPGDPSSAAFLAAAAALLPGSQVQMPGVLSNPTRTGFFEALRWMGGDVRVTGERDTEGEPVANYEIRHAVLHGIEIPASVIPFMIDEIPILAVLATQARGVTVIHGVGEARLKETDRVAATVEELGKMGAALRAEGDDLVVEGPTPLHGAILDARGDHRTAMSLALAARVARGRSRLSGARAVDKSWPGFFATLDELSR